MSINYPNLGISLPSQFLVPANHSSNDPNLEPIAFPLLIPGPSESKMWTIKPKALDNRGYICRVIAKDTLAISSSFGHDIAKININRQYLPKYKKSTFVLKHIEPMCDKVVYTALIASIFEFARKTDSLISAKNNDPILNDLYLNLLKYI
jgi:hypothetical protein